MPPKKSDLRDLWSEDNGTKAIVRPQRKAMGNEWSLDPEMMPSIEGGVRTRKIEPYKPNKRSAVALPHPSQSYNPDDMNHQVALKKVAEKLEMKKEAHNKFVKMITNTGKVQNKGTLVDDGNWEEEVKDGVNKEMSARKTKKTTKKTRVKKVVRDSIRASKKHRRHPDRDGVVANINEIDTMSNEVSKAVLKSDLKSVMRKEARKDGLGIKSFGRHHHTPMVMDVATTKRLVGSLRAVSNDAAAHSALDRVKSLEERNIIPARMRHTYNKRKVLKPKGEVTVKREQMGMVPDPDDHSLPPP